MKEEKFWHLLSVKLTGEATVEDLQALEQLLQQDPSFRLQAHLMTELWKKDDTTENKPADFFDWHLQRLSNHPNQPRTIPAPETSFTEQKKNRGSMYRWLLPASGIAASFCIMWLLLHNGSTVRKNTVNDPASQNTVITRKGSKYNILLPDGSVAWLNADSKITYEDHFRSDLREVSLEGEAFFDVVKDKTRPFIIHTRTIDIRVLGTAFNVRAYETEKNTETSLFRGSVQVTLHNHPDKIIVLKPSEKLLVNNKNFQLDENKNKKSPASDAEITVGKVHFQAKDSSAWETLWIKNKLVFDAESLEEVSQKIERWYDVKVIINGDDILKKTAYSAIFDNESLEQVMEALKITGNFTYAINKNTVTIK